MRAWQVALGGNNSTAPGTLLLGGAPCVELPEQPGRESQLGGDVPLGAAFGAPGGDRGVAGLPDLVDGYVAADNEPLGLTGPLRRVFDLGDLFGCHMLTRCSMLM